MDSPRDSVCFDSILRRKWSFAGKFHAENTYDFLRQLGLLEKPG